MKYTVDQDRDTIVGLRETVVVDGEPCIVTDIEAAPGTSWFLSRLNRANQSELKPSKVIVTFERFDGNPA